MKLSDFKGLFKTSLLTIDHIEHIHGDYYQINMKPEAGCTWYPGDHGIFTLPNCKVEGKKWRAFSVASIPEERIMILGTRTGKEISGFKKELIAMKMGDKVKVRGPFGWFKVQDETSPIVMVAGGVGITPMRALMKQLEEDKTRPIELVYSAADYFLFVDELQSIALVNPQITIHQTTSREETRETLARVVGKYKGEAYYFLSGKKPFIKAMKKQIAETGVKGKRIINDPFSGY